ncbi:hypothetical protein FDP41_002654 [Naegleria fowleri]|uniref:Uncharacterized protein n=1 Tax=Naegleria fowleri TaxID=5763 RepID=A0A6A5BYX0_NAEFO|nr:uncharacterized protein FDP41_002654 [Naegleria fowleri]KAF0978139.1 hypothetical protein FDP41_002654 [Naegleria fowleri]
MFNCVMKGNHLVWNTEFEEARNYLNSLKTNPRMTFELGSIAALSSNISGETAMREQGMSDLENAEHALKKISKKDDILKLVEEYKALNKKLKEASEDYYTHTERSHKNFVELEEMNEEQILHNFELDLTLLNGETHLLRGILQFHASSYLKGFYNLRKAYLKFKEVYTTVESLKDEPKTSPKFVHSDLLHGAYFGLGIFNFMLSILPPTLAKILSVLGFDADRDQGLHLLKQVHDYGGRHLGNGGFMLCLNYLFIPRALQDREKNLQEVSPILERIGSRFPKSGFFKFIHSHYDRKAGDINSAISNLKDAIQITAKSMGTKPNNFLFELGVCYMLIMNFTEAAAIMEDLVKSEKEFDTKGISCMLLSVCKLKLGDKERANILIKDLDKYVSKNSRIDKFALEKVDLIKHINTEEEKHLMMLVSIFQILYLRRDLANLSADIADPLYQFFLSVAKDVKIDDKSKVHGDIESGMCVVKGQFLRQLGKKEESSAEFQKALTFENKIKLEKQWIAFSHYEIAESCYLGDVKTETDEKKKLQLLHEVKKSLEKCNKLSGYPFEEVLHSRAKLALKQVEHEIKELAQKEK